MLEDPELGVATCGVLLLKRIADSNGLDGLWRVRTRYKQWKAEAAAENSSFTSSATAVISAAAVGATMGLVFYVWGSCKPPKAERERPQQSPARRESELVRRIDFVTNVYPVVTPTPPTLFS